MPFGVNESGVNRLRDAHLHLDLQSLTRRPAEYGPGANAAVDPPAGGWTRRKALDAGKGKPPVREPRDTVGRGITHIRRRRLIQLTTNLTA